MKTNNIVFNASLMGAMLLLASCDDKVLMESVVGDDGSVVRTIVIQDTDSASTSANFFALRPGLPGWEVETNLAPETEPDSAAFRKTQYAVTFRKRFANVDELNREMDSGSDTLFRVRSSFDKRFRWFYTYIDYEDTYVSLHRFKHSNPDNFFTVEDYAFIDRLPASRKRVTPADSVFLEHLNSKLVDGYGIQAIYEEHYQLMREILDRSQVDEKYRNDYARQKGYLYSVLTKKENDDLFSEDTFMIQVLDSLHWDIPVEKFRPAYAEGAAEIKSRVEFMSRAAFENSYMHAIRMPWPIIETNADSVSGNALFFRPDPIKFMLHDYTMRATSRRMNYWAVVVSAIVVLVTVALFWRKR